MGSCEKMFHPKYDNQVIFSFDDDDTPKSFLAAINQSKYQYRLGTTLVQFRYSDDGKLILNWDMDRQLEAACQQITSKTRIYILGHGAPGNNNIYSAWVPIAPSSKDGHHIPTSAYQVASLIAMHMKGLMRTGISDHHPKLKISLLTCNGGTPTNAAPANPRLINNSLAAHLLDEFARLGINCAISARLSVMHQKGCFANQKVVRQDQQVLHNQLQVKMRDILSANIKPYSPLILATLEQHEQTFYPRYSDASKVIYQYKQGRQTIITAYNDKKPCEAETFIDNMCRHVAIEILNNALSSPRLPAEFVVYLQYLLNQIMMFSYQSVRAVLEKEVKSNWSFFGNKKQDMVKGFLEIINETETKIRQLIRDLPR